jgi:hypothetical protein
MNNERVKLPALIGKILGRKTTPVPPLPVSEALRLAMSDIQKSPEFFRSLLELELFSIGKRDPQAGHGSGILLVDFPDAGGDPFFPVFSQRELVPKELPEGMHRVAMPGRELLELARGSHRVVLDPGHEPFRVFTPADVDTILDKLRKSGQ